MKNLKITLLTLTTLICTQLHSAEAPPRAPKPAAAQKSASYFGTLPAELRDEVLQYALHGGEVLNIPALAKTITAMGTAIKPEKLLNIFKSLPTYAAVLYLADLLQSLPGMQNKQIEDWLENIREDHPFINGQQLFNEARYKGNEPLITRLLQNKYIDLNFKDHFGNTPLMAAGSNTQNLKLFLKAGANPDIQNPKGATALMTNSDHGNLDNIKLLLAAGANPNLLDGRGWTALIFAVIAGKENIVKLLLAAGGNPNIQDADGRTAISFSTIYGDIKIINLLLAAGAKPNIKSKLGLTALFYAASIGNKQIANVLLAAGADKNIQDNEGETPQDYALENDHRDLAQLLDSPFSKSKREQGKQ